MWNKIKRKAKLFLSPIYQPTLSNYAGFYGSFSECRIKNINAADFNNLNYAKWAKEKTDRYLKLPIHRRTTWYIQDLKFLMHVQSLLDRLGGIKIFDFGGGVGWHYVKLFNLKKFSNIQYTVFDVPEVVRISKEYFEGKNFNNIKFVNVLPKDSVTFDICMLSSVLHYVEDYKGLLKKICSYNPTYLFINRLPAGNVQEFVTLQTINEARFPCYVFNWQSIKSILLGLNYVIYDEWDELESFYLNVEGKEITLPTYKGALFVKRFE